ncbi:hypothetical protein NE865_07806 [Phthorimaea operculella]|nr:hypothetical protein NE865_07806 [Phthorimaea operculella]
MGGKVVIILNMILQVKTIGVVFLFIADTGTRLLPPKPAYTKLSGDLQDALNALTDAMYRKGPENLVKHGKFNMNFTDAADELRAAEDLNAREYDPAVANAIAKKLENITKPVATGKMEQPIKDIIDIASKHLAQTAEHDKEKGDAFKYLVQKMLEQPDEILTAKGHVRKTMGDAAHE